MTPTERLRLAVPPGRGYIVQVQSDDLAALLAERDALAAVAEAARDYSPERDHDWRCEYRTAEVGYVPGGKPVIRCECGRADLDAALAAYDKAVSKP